MSIVHVVANEIKQRVDNHLINDTGFLTFDVHSKNDIYYESLLNNTNINILNKFAADIISHINQNCYLYKIHKGICEDIYIIIEYKSYYALIFIENNFNLNNTHICINIYIFKNFQDADNKLSFFERFEDEDEEDDYYEDDYNDY